MADPQCGRCHLTILPGSLINLLATDGTTVDPQYEGDRRIFTGDEVMVHLTCPRYAQRGTEQTSCCGALATYDGDGVLHCKKCYEPVAWATTEELVGWFGPCDHDGDCEPPLCIGYGRQLMAS